MGIGGDPGGGMAHLQRLKWCLLGVFLVAVPVMALADEYPAQWGAAQQVGKWGAGSGTGAGAYETALLACRAFNADWTVSSTYQYVVTDRRLQCLNKWNNPESSYAVQIALCPWGGTAQGVAGSGVFTCTCPSGTTWNATTQQCQVPQCPEGQARNPWFGNCQDECPQAGGGASRSHVTSGNAVCLHGCKRTRAAHPGGSSCVRSLDMFAGGGSELICDYAYTGEMCGWFGELAGDNSEPGEGDPPGEENPDPPEETCPAGMQSGTFNGKRVCLKAGETTSQQQTATNNTTTTSNNTSTNVNTTTHTSTNYNSFTNSTTVTTTTTTTTTTTNNETNESTTNTTTNVSQSELPGNQSTIPGNGGAPNGENGSSGECDPAVQECGTGDSSFSGACGEPPLCMGDALQCAIARHTHETQCALRASDEVMEAWASIRDFVGTGEGEGLDRKQIEVPTALDITEVGGGAGLVDETYSIMGRAIVIPFSEINRFITILGYAIMVIAWIGAWRIIVGAF